MLIGAPHEMNRSEACLSAINLNNRSRYMAFPPPPRVNYRHNLWALKARGVDSVLAVASVGAISRAHAPGDLVLPHQIIDYSSGRESTFFDGGDRTVVHVDFTHPYSLALRARCL